MADLPIPSCACLLLSNLKNVFHSHLRLAKLSTTARAQLITNYSGYCRNGIPRCFSNARAWLSSRAVVTMVTFMPLSLSTFA